MVCLLILESDCYYYYEIEVHYNIILIKCSKYVCIFLALGFLTILGLLTERLKYLLAKKWIVNF